MTNPNSLLNVSISELKVLLSKSWKNYFWYLLLSTVLFQLAGLIIFKLFLFDFTKIQNFITSDFDFNNFPYLTLCGVIVILFLLFGGSSLLSFGFHRVAVNSIIDQSPKMILIKGAENFIRTFFSVIASCLLIYGSAVLAIFFVALVIYLSEISGLAVVLMISLFLVFVYCLFRLMYFWYRIVLDGDGPVEALKNSSSLVRGRWWTVFGIFLLLAVSFAALSFVVDVVLQNAFSYISGNLFETFSNDFQLLIVSKNFAGIPELLSQIYQFKFIVFSFFQTLVQSFFMIFIYYGGLAIYLALKKSAPIASKKR